MASTFKERFSRALPGSGKDSAGSPKQGKVEVSGVIEVTTYGSGGESLKPADIGLTAIDWIDLKHENEAGGKEGSEPRMVSYNFASQDFYIVEESGGVWAPGSATHNLRYRAVGDSAHDVELL